MKTIILIVVTVILQFCEVKEIFCQFIKPDERKMFEKQTDSNDILKTISDLEYHITYDDKSNYYQSPNRKSNIRFIYHNNGFTAKVRSTRIPLSNKDGREDVFNMKYKNISEWHVKFTTAGLGRTDKNEFIPYTGKEIIVNENRAVTEDGNMKINYTNSEEGMRQDFVIKNKPDGTGKLSLIIFTESNLKMKVIENEITFKEKNGELRMSYSKLKVYDKEGKILDAYFMKTGLNEFMICVNDEGANYPVTIDPTCSSPIWTSLGGQANAQFGYSVATAGDVNGDGRSDVIVGAPYFDVGGVDRGKAFVFHGSNSGLSTIPDWTYNGNEDEGSLGWSVSTAEDLNCDGFSEVIVGAPFQSGEFGEEDNGRAYVFYGSPFGLSSLPQNVYFGPHHSLFGYSVCSYKKQGTRTGVVIGAPNYLSAEGKVYVHYSTNCGVDFYLWTAETRAFLSYFGKSVASGEYTNDNLSEIVVGAETFTNGGSKGKVFVYQGYTSGLLPTSGGDEFNSYASIVAQTGFNLIECGNWRGDVNNDNKDDLFINEKEAGSNFTGKVLGFYGPIPAGVINPNTANWSLAGSQANSSFGESVSIAGDVSGDGISDLVIGAPFYDNGQTDEGVVFLYLGSGAGLSTTPYCQSESDQANAHYGYSVNTAGNVDSDVMSEYIIGAPHFENSPTNEGKAYVLKGGTLEVPCGGIGNVSIGATPYVNLKEAFDDINAGVHGNGYIEVHVNCNTIEPFPGAILNGGVFTSCKIVPTANVSSTGNFDGSVIILNGAENVTIDGTMIPSGPPKSYTIINTSGGANSGCVKMISDAANNRDASNNFVINLIAQSASGNNIYIADALPFPFGNNGNTIENCTIDGGNMGINVTGSSISNSNKINSGTIIQNNEVKNCKMYGINANINSNNNIISGNFISLAKTSVSPFRFYGISCYAVGENHIEKNKIYNIASPSSGIIYTGIHTLPELTSVGAINTTTNNVINNFISMTVNNASVIIGIHCTGSSVTQTTNLNHNTVYIGNNGGSPLGSSMGIKMTFGGSNSVHNVYNNISVNERSVLPTQMNLASEITPPVGVTINMDYNCYWAPLSLIVRWKTIANTFRDLPQYHCAAFPNEQNSNFKQVTFVSPTTSPELATASINDYDLIGKSGVEDFDIYDVPRNADYPYMGAKEEAAFEFDGTIRLRVFLDGVKKPELGKINVEIWERAQFSGGGNIAGDALQPVLYSFNELPLNTSGTVSIECPAVYNKNFYIVIKYPGLLETWSRASGEVFPNSPSSSSDAFLNFDLTTVDLTGRTLAFNNNLKQCCDHKYFIFTGDTQGDGRIDFDDYWNVVADADAADICSGFTSGTGTGTQTLSLHTNLDFSTEAAPVRCPDICLVDENPPWYVEVKSNPGVGEDFVGRPSGFDVNGYHNTYILNEPYTSGWFCSCAF